MWEEVVPILAKVVPSTGGRFTLSDIADEIIQGRQTLWIAFDDHAIHGILTTSFNQYPQKKMLNGVFCAGTQIKDWKDVMLTTLDSWAIENDCDGFEMTGRPGWKRFLAPYGWEQSYGFYEKDYSDG